MWRRRAGHAPTSSWVAPASTRELLGASHLLASQCLHWLVRAGIRPWTSPITPRGRLNDRELGASIANLGAELTLNMRARSPAGLSVLRKAAENSGQPSTAAFRTIQVYPKDLQTNLRYAERLR